MRKSEMKKRGAASLGLAALLLVVTGCSNGSWGFGGSQEHNLSFFGNISEASGTAVIEDILDSYMEENEHTDISYESLPEPDYDIELRSREKTEESEELDDVFMLGHDTMKEFIGNESLENLADIAADIPFTESMLGQIESTGHKVYRIPAAVSVYGMYCNMELLESHHQKVPETLEEWVDVCEYFVTCGITPIIANKDDSLKTMAIAKGFYPLYKNGVAERKLKKVNEGEKTLSAYLSDGLTLVRDFCVRGYIDTEKALETEKMSDDIEQFVNGESPFMLTDVSAAGTVKSMNPEFEFKVVPYPVLDEGSVLVINPDVWLSVSAKGEDVETAKEFVSYFLKEENVRKFARSQSAFGPLEGEPDPELTEIQDVVESYRTQICVVGVDNNIEFPLWDITSEVTRRILEGEELEGIITWMDKEVHSGE